MDSARLYEGFAATEARGNSPAYEALAVAVAREPTLLRLLDALPVEKRQPNLLFAAVRSLGGPLGPSEFLAWTLDRWNDVAAIMSTRRTQTNEAGRLAALMPLLAAFVQPVALLEVGAAAGLCLYPDKWRYRYGDLHVGAEDAPLLACEAFGDVSRVPTRPPRVAWRAGIDLNPLDASNADDVEWLRSLVWPGQTERATRLDAALQIARTDPPFLVKGDLVGQLGDLAAQAPPHATVVVYHSAVLAYVEAATRDAFVDLVSSLPGHWISNEAPAVLPTVAETLPAGATVPDGKFLTAVDGVAVGWAGPHGQDVRWF